MTTNESGLDRLVRVVIAIAAIAGGIVVGTGTVMSWVLFAVAAIMLITAATGFCPLYRVFGVSTCRR
jgi:uncharacterized membrane protein YcjF (UPF0283 family)